MKPEATVTLDLITSLTLDVSMARAEKNPLPLPIPWAAGDHGKDYKYPTRKKEKGGDCPKCKQRQKRRQPKCLSTDTCRLKSPESIAISALDPPRPLESPLFETL